MMKIKDFETGAFISTALLNGGVQLKVARNGNEYLQILFKDMSGEVIGMMWTPDLDDVDNLKAAKVLFVEGDVDEFNGNKQIKCKTLRVAKEDEYEISDLLRIEPGYSDEVMEKLDYYKESILDRDLYMITESLYSMHRENYKNEPAAISHHHSALGGMAVHVLQVLEISLGILKSMEPLMTEEEYLETTDYIKAGAILHDIGKFYEYEKDEFGYYIGITTRGALEGHPVIGYNLVMSYGNNLGLDMDKITQLAHICLSHHKNLEWGAPVTPATRAAFIVTYGDQASSMVHPALVGVEEQDAEISDTRNPFGNRSVKL